MHVKNNKLRAQDMLTILGSIIQHNWGGGSISQLVYVRATIISKIFVHKTLPNEPIISHWIIQSLRLYIAMCNLSCLCESVASLPMQLMLGQTISQKN